MTSPRSSGAHARRGRFGGRLKWAAGTIRMMIPLVLLGILMLPPLSLLLLPPQKVGLGICIPSPVVLGDHYLGVAPTKPWLRSTQRFAAETGVSPGIVENYAPFGEAFDQARACKVTHLGAVPLIQLTPFSASVASIAAGRYDSFLHAYAHAVRMFDDPVILSFAPEANGSWYSWGCGHTPPRVYVAAWRHIWQIFARAGAQNVTWLWDVNRNNDPGQECVAPLRDWWPGSTYVNWVGIDAYFDSPADTFTSVFGSTLASIRQITSRPVLITETAIAPNPQQDEQIRGLFAGVTADMRAGAGLLGFVWFDLDRREAWHLESRPEALAVFSSEAGRYESLYSDTGYEWKRHQ